MKNVCRCKIICSSELSDFSIINPFEFELKAEHFDHSKVFLDALLGRPSLGFLKANVHLLGLQLQLMDSLRVDILKIHTFALQLAILLTIDMVQLCCKMVVLLHDNGKVLSTWCVTDGH
jgi:hypothetical protein